MVKRFINSKAGRYLVNKENFYLVLVILGYLIFHRSIENLLNTLFVDKIFSQVQSTYTTDISVIMIALIITGRVIINITNRVFLMGSYINLVVVTHVIYLFYRVSNDVWYFTPFDCSPLVRYLDIIVLFTIGEVVTKLSFSRTDKCLDENNSFIYDEALREDEEDCLNRENYAKAIYSKIEDSYNTGAALAIGIQGEWGSGKTSFLTLLKRNIDRKRNIVIDFKPWLNKGSSSILDEFFTILRNEVARYNPNISKQIKKYLHILLKHQKSHSSLLYDIYSSTFSDDAALEKYQKVNKSLNRLSKKLIVFIDDLDRLDVKEVFEVIRIIRNTASFGNTIFIVAYDRAYIVDSLKQQKIFKPELYLEKIFQVEVLLPEYESKVILSFLFEKLFSFLSESDQLEFDSIMGGDNSLKNLNANRIIMKSIRSLRDANRFINSFSVIYTELNREVELKDLLLLEIIKLKYPLLYSTLIKYKEEYLNIELNNNAFYTLRKETANGKENYKFFNYLEDKKDHLNIHSPDLSLIKDIVKYLFPDKNYNSYQRSIISVANVISFSRYTHFRVLSNSISTSKFWNSVFNDPPEKIKDNFEKWIGQELRNDITNKFKAKAIFATKEELIKTIEAIFIFGRIPKMKELDLDYEGYDYWDFANKTNPSDFELDRIKYQKDSLIEFVHGLFRHAPSPYIFEASIISQIIKSYPDQYTLNENRLLDLLTNYFKLYLAKATSFDINVLILFNNCHYSQHEHAIDSANKLLIDFIYNKDLTGFIELCCIKNISSNCYSLDPIFGNLFSDFKQFKEGLIMPLSPLEENNVKEFESFYKSSKKNQNKVSFNDFDFDIINVDSNWYRNSD